MGNSWRFTVANKKYQTKIAESVHKTVEDLYSIRLVKKRTMKNFDEMCLTPVKPLSPRQITRIREREEVSQAVFARHLGLSINPSRSVSAAKRSLAAPRSNSSLWSTKKASTG